MRAVAVCLVVVFLVTPAGAPAGENRSPFEVDLAVDLPLTLGAAAAAALPEFFKSEVGGPWCKTECDPSGVNALDRTVIGNHSELAAAFSDAFVNTEIFLPHVLGLIDTLASKPTDGWTGYGKDTLVLLETLAVNSLVNNVVKYAVRRPRPYVYDLSLSDQERTVPDAALSFYSGHTSTSFAMATAYSYLFTLRHPDSPLVIPIWIGTHLLAATTGLLRVEAGKHFWTDVLVGAVVGSGIGLLVPRLHRRTDPDPSPGSSGGTLSISPAVTSNGIGFSMVW